MRRALLLPLLITTLLAGLLAGCGGHHHAPAKSAAPQSATGSVHPDGWGSTPKGLVLPAPLLTAVPTATMYDAITVGPVPANPFAVAGYTAGNWPDYLSLRAAFPRAHAISIAIRASYRAACLDDEPGDATPSQAGPWVLADIHAGFARPCVYGDLSEMPAIQASLRVWLGSGWRARVFLWLAWYRGFPGLVPGYDAVQYTSACLGRNLDCSTVTLDFLRIAQPPYVAPKPTPVLPLCFTHRETAAQCAAVKVKIASWQRAAASSLRAWDKLGDDVLFARMTWFANHVNKPPKSKHLYREQALASTQRAYKARGGYVLMQRYWWFLGSVQNAKLAN